MGEIFFANGDILHTSNFKVERHHPVPQRRCFAKSFSFSCKLESNTDLSGLIGGDDDKGTIIFKVRETKERTYPRYPRKMKKALKKLAKGGCKMTRIMNKLTMI